MNVRKVMFLLLLLIAGSVTVDAQQGFGTNAPAASAVVDMTATNKGVLLPRVALTATTVAAPVSAPATNLVVFNTATAGDVTPGLYYWTGTVWKRQLAKGDTGNDWQRTGNAGTNPSVNALGTNDAQSLVVKTNNAERMRISSSGSVGVNTASPNSSALLDVSSTTQVFLPPRMTSAQIAAIASPVEGLIVYNTDLKCAVYYAKGTFNSFSTAPLTCGNPMTVTHTVGSVAPVTKTVTYGTVLTSIGGTGSKCWITQNLGADHQATIPTDATEPSSGWYWQFNRAQGYKNTGTTLTPAGAWQTTINESSDWTTDNDPCSLLLGAGWRLPTRAEWLNYVSNGSITNYTDAYNSVLKLHAGGDWQSTSSSWPAGDGIVIWSSSSLSTDHAYNLFGNVSLMADDNNFKSYARSVRCLRD